MNEARTNDDKKSCCGPTCCGGAKKAETQAAQSADAVRDTVRSGYAKIAESGSWSAAQQDSAPGCCSSGKAPSGGGCCGPSDFTPEELVRAIGYTAEELAAMPSSANMGLSCGNPTALASLKEGETVLDLGSGGGFDCFIAGRKVGPTGRVIGIDMTPAMLSKARGNTVAYAEATVLDNVEFRLGEIENLPVADASVDVVISNCVLNLSPDQPRVWKEIARVLKAGGRIAISDLVLRRPLPASVKNDVEALIGCVAGASLISDIEKFAAAAGLADLQIECKRDYVDAMIDLNDPLYKGLVGKLSVGERLGDYVTSANISAWKK